MTRVDKIKHYLKHFLLRLFVNKNDLKPSLHILVILVEVFLYLAIILGLPLSLLIRQNGWIVKSVIFIVFKCLLGIRLRYKLSIIKAFYGIILTISLLSFKEGLTAVPFIIIICLVILTVIDILSNTSFQFIEHNITAQNHNIIKILHYIVFWFGLISYSIYNNALTDGIMIGLFIIMYIVKKASMCYHRAYKQLLLRCYLGLSFVHLAKIIAFYSNISLFLPVCLSLVVSQLVFGLFEINRAVFKADELNSRQEYIKLGYKILVYLHGQSYSKQMQRQILVFLGQEEQNINLNHRHEHIYEKLINILSNQVEFHAQIILAQIYLAKNHSMLKTKLILEKEKRKLKWFDINPKILIYRMEESLMFIYNNKNREIKFEYYQSYELCDKFRELLLKSSFTLVVLWQYVKKIELKPQKLRLVAQKAISYQQRIDQSYSLIPTKCIKLKLLYVAYLFQAVRDINKAKQVLEEITFNQDFQINLKIDQKVFIEFGLEEQPLTIMKVGQNISNLLGYQRRQIEGQKYSIFLPEFYIKQHKDIINTILEQNFQKLFYFSRQTIIKTKHGHYQHCNLVLRLSYSITNEMILQGYIQIISTQAYNLFYYMFVNSQQQIIDCAQNLQSMAPTKTKYHKISQFFQAREKLDGPLIQSHKDSLVKYHPMLKFNLNDDKWVIYYIRSQIASNKTIDIDDIFYKKIISALSSMSAFKLQWKFIKKYHQKMSALRKKIKSKSYIVMIVVMVLALIGVYVACSMLMLVINKERYQSQKEMKMTENLILLYNSTINIGLKTTYIDLQETYNYSNKFVIQDIVSQVLKLQSFNHKFKPLSNKIYNVTFPITNQTHEMSLYDLILQLSSDAYLYKLMRTDAFLLRSMRFKSREYIPNIFNDNLNEYKVNWQAQIQQINSFLHQMIIITVIIILSITICALIFYLEYKMRINEHQTLMLMLITRYEQFVESIKLFIGKITQQDISSYVYQDDQVNHNARYNRQSFIVDINNNTTQRQRTKSQMSLKQISGRDLLGGQSLNQSNILQMQSARNENTSTKQKRKSNEQTIPSHSIELEIAKPKKLIIIIPIVATLLFIGLSIGNQIQHNLIGKLNQQTSTKNLFQLMDPIRTYSSLSISFMNIITLKTYQKVYSNYNLFSTFLNNLTSSTKSIIQFKEYQFPQFKPFQSKVMQLQHKYICTYTACNPQFAGEINIVYISTIDKLQKKMLKIKDQLSNYTLDELRKDIFNGSLKYNLDLLYYTEYVIRSQMIEAFRIYFDCYWKFIRIRSIKKKWINVIAFHVVVVATLLFGYFVYYFCKNKDSLERIAMLVKTSSEINKDRLIGDYELLKDKEVIEDNQIKQDHD